MPAKREFQDSELALLLRVLKQSLEEAGSEIGRTQATDLAGELGKVIMDSFVSGERDPAKLKKAALDSIKRI
jgi:hypothetical protein